MPKKPGFLFGTMIRTKSGMVAVENLEQGDLVRTKEGGYLPIRSVEHYTLSTQGEDAPIQFDVGAIGNQEVLFLPPRMKVYYDGWEVQLITGVDEALIETRWLVNNTSITRTSGGIARYYNLDLDTVELVQANDVWCEI